jgi:autotransporter-associated beta strand protein
LSLGATNRIFDLDNVGLDIGASVSGGPGAGIINSRGQLSLFASNSYSGPTVINGGSIEVHNDFALGGASAGTTVNPGSFLFLDEVQVGSEPLTLNDAALSSSFSNFWGGAIILAGDCTIFAQSIFVNGAISGSGKLTKRGAGTLTLAGAAPNTYSGGTVVEERTLVLAKAPGVTAIPGALIIGDGTNDFNVPDTVRLNASNQIADPAVVTVNSSGLLDLNGFSEVIGSLVGPASVLPTNGVYLGTNSSSALRTGGNNAFATYSGNLKGAGGLIKEGFGAFILDGNTSAFNGPTTVNAGTLLMNAAGGLGTITTVNTGATLGGSSGSDPVFVGTELNVLSGTLSPGNGPGFTGILRATGTAGFNAASIYRVDINGPEPGTGYDQLIFGNSLGLTNTTLNMLLGAFAPAEGDQFNILQEPTNVFPPRPPVSGTFSGLSEGAIMTVNGLQFQITYRGGPRTNNVVLTLTNTPLWQWQRRG